MEEDLVVLLEVLGLVVLAEEAGLVVLVLSLIGRFPNVMCGMDAIDPDISAISRVLRAESSAWMERTWALSLSRICCCGLYVLLWDLFVWKRGGKHLHLKCPSTPECGGGTSALLLSLAA